MNDIWDKVYSDDTAFFGEGPSSFAKKCFSQFSQKNVKKILELGCGQGRDTIFFALSNFDVYALDSSKIAIKGINKLFKKYKNESLKNIKCIDVKQGLPFDNNYFDLVYSHMFYNMNFTNKELDFLFHESHRVLKTNGLLYFSVRSNIDKLFKTGRKIDEDDIYEINGFQIRFFSMEQIKLLLSSFNFDVDEIRQDYEDLSHLYFAFCHKKNNSNTSGII